MPDSPLESSQSPCCSRISGKPRTAIGNGSGLVSGTGVFESSMAVSTVRPCWILTGSYKSSLGAYAEQARRNFRLSAGKWYFSGPARVEPKEQAALPPGIVALLLRVLVSKDRNSLREIGNEIQQEIGQ